MRRAGGIGGLGQPMARLFDGPLAVRLAGNAARALGFVDGGVADTDAAGSLSGRVGQFGHGGGPLAADENAAPGPVCLARFLAVENDLAEATAGQRSIFGNHSEEAR